MKKFKTLFLGILLAFSLTACGSAQGGDTATNAVSENTTENTGSVTTENSEEASVEASSSTENTEEAGVEVSSSTENSEDMTEPDSSEDASSEEMTETGSKILVVYYSASGNTERVANDIADTLQADIFELVPENPYTDEDLDWTTDGSRVNQEHDDETLRDIPLTQSTVENWDSYDTVFIGYPIWWGIAAWPVNEFVTDNDFTGKTVIPFATSASSGMGESGTLLEEMAGTGTWQEGQRFSSGASAEDVAAWANGLGL